jgi:hypothetical protein
MMSPGAARLRLAVLIGLLVVAAGVAYFALRPGTGGAIEYHIQRLGHEDREVARKSELALLSLGVRGRQALFDFLVRKHNLSLVPLSFKGGNLTEADKVLAVSGSGDVEVRGPAEPAREIVLLADASVPAEKVFHVLSGFAGGGTVRVTAVASAPGSKLTSLELDLTYLKGGKLRGYITLRIGPEHVNLAGETVALPEDVAGILEGKTAESVRVIPRPGVQYARLLRYVYCLQAAGKRALFVFGDPGVFSPTSPEHLVQFSRSLESADATGSRRAATAIKEAVGELFSYDLSKPPEENKAAVEEWLKWFRRNKDYLYYDTVMGKYVYDAGASAAGIEHDTYWRERLEIRSAEPASNKRSKEGGTDG